MNAEHRRRERTLEAIEGYWDMEPWDDYNGERFVWIGTVSHIHMDQEVCRFGDSLSATHDPTDPRRWHSIVDLDSGETHGLVLTAAESA